MLFFIMEVLESMEKLMEFQYIQCYFLSSFGSTESVEGFGFQYIQCYFLSETEITEIQIGMAFQYIQCYFLSKLGAVSGAQVSISIHPMLFFIHGTLNV